MFWILFAHFLGDSALQPERHANEKGKVLRYMITHCFVYAGIVSVMFVALEKFKWYFPYVLLISHFIVDTSLRSKDVNKKGWIGWIDQGLHISVLGGLLWIK